METISSFLTQDHRACDEEFASMENEVASENWEEANTKLIKFSNDFINCKCMALTKNSLCPSNK